MIARNCDLSPTAGKLLTRAFLVGIMAVSAASASAQTRTWTGNGSSTGWNASGNWSGGHIPTGSGTETVDFPAVANFSFVDADPRQSIYHFRLVR